MSDRQNKLQLAGVDAIVMLTWSDWYTEMRSNRYHYASRFAKMVPVIFVQPDLATPGYRFEETEIPNVTVLHLYNNYDQFQAQLLNKALLEKGIIRPVLWVYNGNFQQVLRNRYALLTVFHGTEDYFASDSHIQIRDKKLLSSFNAVLEKCNLLVAVSDGVRESFENKSQYKGEIITVTNGCDYKFYANDYPVLEQKIVFYQGNIYDKLDYNLLLELAVRLPSWTFRFCGKVVYNEKGWKKLKSLSNIEYLGLLKPEGIKVEASKATVGIVPFVQSEWIMERSFPLKVFEYLACGLPVVTVPIKSLLPHAEVLQFATTVDEFEAAILQSESQRCDADHTRLRKAAAAKQDYDLKVMEVAGVISAKIQTVHENKLNIAVCYEPCSVHVSTITEHLNSFVAYSSHNVAYLPATQGLNCDTDLSFFDVLIIHYSIRLSVQNSNWMLSPSYQEEFKKFGGFKVLFIQDEYEGTEIARQWISSLGIHRVYSCVPQQSLPLIYPPERFPSVSFVTSLTGYVPSSQPCWTKYAKTVERKITIGYRGRKLPYWYGTLGQEKYEIGIKTRELCVEKGLLVDIETDADKRIYGDAWYDFLGSCRATLATESGANIFDFDGSIRNSIETRLAENKDLTFADIYDEIIAPNEKIQMNQISPKLFEAIAAKTALILFEGEYSNVLIPRLHYISLKKDFSNFEEVLHLLADDAYIEQITERAYEDIIRSETYSYNGFVKQFDRHLAREVRTPTGKHDPLYMCIVFQNKTQSHLKFNIRTLLTAPSQRLFNLEQLRENPYPIDTDTWLFISKKMLHKFTRHFLQVMKGRLRYTVAKCVPQAVKQRIKFRF